MNCDQKKKHCVHCDCSFISPPKVLNRLTFASTLSHLRRVNSPIGRDGKLAKPRQLHNTLWGMVCPAETPEVNKQTNLGPRTILKLPGLLKIFKKTGKKNRNLTAENENLVYLKRGVLASRTEVCRGWFKNINGALLIELSAISMNWLTNCGVSGSCCGSGEELGPHGLHLCGLSAVSHPGVSWGVEYGEPGGDLTCCHCWVS